MDYNQNIYNTPVNTTSNEELDWDSVITLESEEMPLLAPGTYPFTVISLKKGRFSGSAKMCACPEAILGIEIFDSANNRSITISESLYLHKFFERKLSDFFTAIGQKRKGEPLKPDWDHLVGARGMLELNHREYNGKKYNNIRRFADVAQQNQRPEQTGWQSGRF